MFQNYLVKRVAEFVNKKFNTHLSIGEISYDGWTYFTLRQVNLGDQKNDTLFYAGRIQFNIIGAHLDSSRFILNDVILDEGLCKMTTYKDGTFSFAVLDYFSNPNDTIIDPNALPFVLDFRNVECMDTRFILLDSTGIFSEEGFDYNRMDVDGVNFNSKRFVIQNDSLNFDLKNFSCHDRSGFVINRLNASVIICPNLLEFKDLDLITPNSHIKNYFSMSSHGWDEYKDFLNKVVLKGTLMQSDVDMKDIVYFAPMLKNYHYKARVSAKGNGTISNLSLKNIVATVGKETKFTGNAKFKGLPNVEETFIDVKADYASTVSKELESVIDMKLPAAVADLGKIVYRGQYTGFFKDFVSYGVIETQFGNMETDLNMKLNEKTMQSKYSGKLKIDHFNLGAYLKNTKVGVISLAATINGEGFDLEHLHTRFETQVDQIHLDGYTYKNADIKGAVVNKKLTVFFDVQDTSLILNSQLKADFSGAYTHYELDGVLDHANLKALHLHNEYITLGTDLFADFYFKNLNDNYGTLRIAETHYEKAGFTYRIAELQLETEIGMEKAITLKGDFVKASVKGKFDVTELYSQLYYWTSSLGVNYLKPEQPVRNPLQEFKLNLNLVSTAAISPLLFPGFNVSNVELEAEVDSKQKSYSLLAYAGSINLNQYQFLQTTIKLNEQEASSGELLMSMKQFGKADTMYIGDFALKAEAKVNHIDLQYQITDSNSIVMGSFKQGVDFFADRLIIDNKPSWVGGKGSKWDITEGKALEINSKQLTFNNFLVTNKNQLLQIDGTYSFSGIKKDITCRVKNFELNTINKFTNQLSIEMGGIANGSLNYKNVGKREVILSNLKVENLALDGDTLGDYNLVTGYQENDDKLAIGFESLKGRINNLKGVGNYAIQDNILDLDISFSESEITAFQAFVKGQAKLYTGRVGLKAQLKGHPNDLNLSGNLFITNATFKIEYLQTIYTMPEANLELADNKIKIIPFDIYDVNKRKAHISGEIEHNGFNKLLYNVRVDGFKTFQVLNTTVKNNELFYGVAYASGDFTLKGNTNQVQMNANVTTEKGTRVMINPFGVSGEEDVSYINYVSYDTLHTFGRKAKIIPFGVGINLNISATPDAEIQMLFDAASDDRIRAKGIGQLKLQLLLDGTFKMFGDYEVTEGDYRFSALNVVAKKFILRSGSRISWTGDPMTGELRIVGVYKLKTTINEIVNMSNSKDQNVRVPVECIININGSVDRPVLNFDLNFPDLQSNVTGSAASELNAVVANFRRDPEIMNQQMLFLLISGSFIPITSNNSDVASGVGSQAVSDLLSKQAAGLINKVDLGVDLNVDLLNSSDPTKSKTVVLSATKRFYNNRLEVQLGVSNDNTQSNYSAAYSLKKTGNTKLKVFNRSGFDPIYSRNVQTSGLGLYYRKEFDSFLELFKKQNNYYF